MILIPALRRLAVGLLVLAFVSAITSAGTAKDVQTTGQIRVVALGDSVTSGSNCDCTAFPQLYGDLLHNRSGASVTVDNLGVAGLDSTGLLQNLDQRNSPTEQATSTANVVLLTIGANDFGDHHDDVTSGQCTGDCVSDELEQLTVNLDRILGRVHALRGDLPTTILMTGYWNVFKDGDVAKRQYTASGRIASDQLTVRTNDAVAAAARADDATYVDIYTPFEDSTDITALLAADGDHPDAAGHALIARVLLAATPNPLPTSPRQGG